ncbi:monocarboxylate transporter 3-like isoform X12 [Macrobrachium rosenbergii]|uniref:monocarboxylate transporter 3-like isoform X12 n=1 Tax=Macrobrachium rosenbergii TaxID=79674 RepID=UPI0034D452A3
MRGQRMTFGYFLDPRENPTEFAVLPESAETAALNWERIQNLLPIEDNWSVGNSKEAWKRRDDVARDDNPPEEKSDEMKDASRDTSDFGLVAESIRVDGLNALFPEKKKDIAPDMDEEQGLGAGICMNCCYHISAQYFKKRLGLANGIMVTGGSLGFIVMPLLGAELQEHFSFKWATIIAGCVFMFAVPGTVFFQPIELYMKKIYASRDQEEALGHGQISDAGDGCKGAKQEKEEGRLWKKFLCQFKPSVFRDPLVVTTALFTCLSITTLLNIVALVPFLLNDAGYNLQDASWPVSVAAFTDIATRAVCATVIDFPWLNVRLLYAVAQIIAILAPNALVLGSDNYTMVLLTMGSVGIGLGIMYVLDVYIIIRVLGIEKMQSVYGISQLLRALAYTIIGPMGGVLRQATGSYMASIILYTCTVSVGLCLLTFTCFYTHFRPLKEDKKESI